MEKRYLLVSPCRDEGRFLRTSIESVLKQTIRPELWVIVDDGSSDETPQILREYARAHDWIKVLRREPGSHRSVGPGVIAAFEEGYQYAAGTSYEYLCKLDLDLELPPGYFELLIERMEANPRLGTCSGKPYFAHPSEDRLISERCGDETSVGMTKFYRRSCFEEIGGFVREVMWDGIDCHRCRMLGWQAISWDEPELRFLHLRPMGSSQGSLWEGRKRHGFGQYYMGTGLAYMTASCIYRATHPPFLLGALGMWTGYMASWLRAAPRYEDRKFRHFLRKYHRSCLMVGKKRATQRLDERQAKAWSKSKLQEPSTP